MPKLTTTPPRGRFRNSPIAISALNQVDKLRNRPPQWNDSPWIAIFPIVFHDGKLDIYLRAIGQRPENLGTEVLTRE
jgi:hypothetical protein